jgi:hypothetical protein
MYKYLADSSIKKIVATNRIETGTVLQRAIALQFPSLKLTRKKLANNIK